MVLLISGSSCVGKTRLSKMLMEERHIPYFSVDNLKMGLYRADPENCGFTPTSADAVIANKLWPIIREMAYTYAENKVDIIMEGCYIFPEHIAELDPEYEDDIMTVFLGFSEEYLRENFETAILPNKGVVEDREPTDERHIEAFVNMHSFYRKGCHNHNLKYYEIDKDYVKTVDDIKEDLVELVGK